MLYIGVSAVVGLLSPRWQGRIIPWVFVIPAMVLLTVYLVYPTIGTIITSFTVQTDGDPLANYKQLTSPAVSRDHPQQHHLAHRGHGRQPCCSGCSSRDCSIV